MAEAAEDVSYQRSMIFPKGTKIVGHIVKVTSSGKGRSGGSAIFVQFDKVVMKDGQEVMLNAGIQALAVASPATENSKASADAHTVAEDNSGDTTGNVANQTVVATNYQTPEAVNMPPGPVTAPQGEFNSNGLFTTDSKGAFGRPDLKVYTPTSEGSHGTVILSSRKSLRLDPGTHLLLVVQPPPTESAPESATTPDGSTEPQR